MVTKRDLKFEIGKCPKCKMPIVDSGCDADPEIQELAEKKQIIWICGKSVPIIEIDCDCKTKFKYDRNTKKASLI